MRTPRIGRSLHYCTKAAQNGLFARPGGAAVWTSAAFLSAFFVVAPAYAQETVVIGGDGPRGERITVNIEAIDDNRSRAPQAAPSEQAGATPEEDGAASDRARIGNFDGPLLHFPPQERPRSRLLLRPLADQANGAPPPPPAPERDAAIPPPPRPPAAPVASEATTPPPDVPPAALAERSAPDAEAEPAKDAPRPASKPVPQVAATPQPQSKPATPQTPPQQSAQQASLPEPPPGKPELPATSTAAAGADAETETGTSAGSEPDAATAEQPEESVADAEAAPAPAAEEEPGAEAGAEPSTAEPSTADQLAALPPADSIGTGGELRLLFAAESADLDDAAQAVLQDLADRMNEAPQSRIQLKAYAAGSAETASRARRLSLSRALSVRSFLIDEGIRSTRIDVRALGSGAEDGPADRVDIAPARR